MTLSNGTATAATTTASTNGVASSLAAKQRNLPSHFIGGNRLDTAVPGVVKDFVAKSDGHSVITSVGFFLPAIFFQLRKYRMQGIGPVG